MKHSCSTYRLVTLSATHLATGFMNLSAPEEPPPRRSCNTFILCSNLCKVGSKYPTQIVFCCCRISRASERGSIT